MKQWSTDDIRQFLKSDRAVLILCISIALFVWVINKMSHSFWVHRTVQLNYRLPPGKTFSMLPPSNLRVLLQGEGWDLLRHGNSVIELRLTSDSLQTITKGHLRQEIAHYYNVSEELVNTDAEQILIAIEDERLKEVAVRPVCNLKFAKGYQLSKAVAVTPAKVIVKGPKRILDTLSELQTDTIRGKNLKTNLINQNTGIVLPTSLIRCNERHVNAQLTVEEFTEKAMFLPVSVKNAPTTYKIFPNKIKLSCIVPLSQYNAILPNLFEAEVDVANIGKDRRNNTLSVMLVKQPNGVQNIQFTPKSVEFYFER
jgi:hypothetical protein